MKKLILSALLLLSAMGFGDDLAPVDPGSPEIHPVVETDKFKWLDRFSDLAHWGKEPVLNFAFQTPVKSQGSRGTCSIFSATGMIESLVREYFQEEVDFSEQFLEYIVMDRMKFAASEGSSIGTNIPAVRDHGTVFEATLPYNSTGWSKPEEVFGSEKEKMDELCGALEGNQKQICLLGQLQPDNHDYDGDAKAVSEKYNLNQLQYQMLWRDTDIKKVLDSGRAVVLGLDFFYGAWNHRKMVEYEIGERNMDNWNQGIVSTPTKKDIELSHKNRAGHSIVVMGYDDEARVFYFKNSWGTLGFGMDAAFNNGESTPGYGTITYEYAYNHGTFYKVDYRPQAN